MAVLLEHTFSTAELPINYAEGPASGPPMVLLHGVTARWQTLQSIIPHLTPDWHVYACDLRGHGRSGRLPNRYRMADYIADTIAFLRGRVAEPAAIVGASLGGLVALGVAAAAPELVSALVLLDPAFKFRDTKIADTDKYGWFTWVYDTITTPRSNAEMLERCCAMAPDASEAALQGFVDRMFELAPDAVRPWIEDRELEGFELELVLRQVQVPTLVLYGERQPDSTVRPTDAELAQRTLARGVLVAVPDAGHRIHEEQPNFVGRHMREFLQAT
jgi:pimeloyl-ACP methyl ester carboxylesterase